MNAKHTFNWGGRRELDALNLRLTVNTEYSERGVE